LTSIKIAAQRDAYNYVACGWQRCANGGLRRGGSMYDAMDVRTAVDGILAARKVIT
jgi:hypothetical protein